MHRHDLVPARGAAEARETVPPQAELGLGLSPGRDLERGASLDRRDLDLAPEKCERERDLGLGVDVGSLPTEIGRGLEDDLDEEVACSTPSGAGRSVAGNAENGTVIDSGRNGELDPFDARRPAGSVARRAFLEDPFAGPMASRAFRD